MNIFDALTNGKGRILETNISSLLAYLLDPNQPHGLGNTLIHTFISSLK
ncbi:PD-(D/E)XK nuclease family protein [Bacillus wiedmannii]|nr:PD-(D/E)XK nuclease family protein [Bacillus wiedmannii]MDM5264843.1 PD-(D/E)XK nuclease family protein [Bacillus wiedmannii]